MSQKKEIEQCLSNENTTEKIEADISTDLEFRDTLKKCQIQAASLDQHLKGHTDDNTATNRKLQRLTKYLLLATPYMQSQGGLAVDAFRFLRQCNEKVENGSNVPTKEATEFKKTVEEFVKLLFQNPATNNKLLLAMMSPDNDEKSADSHSTSCASKVSATNIRPAIQCDILVDQFTSLNETPSSRPRRRCKPPTAKDDTFADLAQMVCPHKKLREAYTKERGRFWHRKAICLAIAAAALLTFNFFKFFGPALEAYLTPFNDCAKSNELCQQTGSCCMKFCSSRLTLFFSKLFNRENS